MSTFSCYTTSMELHKDLPVYTFTTKDAWEVWLHENHDQVTAIWIKFAKKQSGVVTITYDEALEVALCYGWIDGLINAYDENYWLTRFTPRKERSVWSKRNQRIIQQLLVSGKMQPSGLAKVTIAKENGTWQNAYDTPKDMQVPEDFLQELAKDKEAEAFFTSLNKANTYAIAWRLQTAKKPETRAKRMEKLLAMMKRGEKLY